LLAYYSGKHGEYNDAHIGNININEPVLGALPGWITVIEWKQLGSKLLNPAMLVANDEDI